MPNSVPYQSSLNASGLSRRRELRFAGEVRRLVGEGELVGALNFDEVYRLLADRHELVSRAKVEAVVAGMLEELDGHATSEGPARQEVVNH